MSLSTAVARVSLIALGPDVYRATLFLGEQLVVKATRPHKYIKRSRGDTILLTVGKPNYKERKFIKLCKKAGEPVPVRRIQIERPKA